MREKRKYLSPVAWLGGRDLLANLKYFLLFAAFKGKLDPRDWMKAETFPPDEGEQSDYFERFVTRGSNESEFWFDYFADAGDGMTAGYAIAYLCMSDLHARVTPDWESSPASKKREDLDKGMPAAEIRSHLAAGHNPKAILKDYEGRAPEDLRDKLRQNEDREEIIRFIEGKTVGVVAVEPIEEHKPSDSLKLPRGAFLFVGGDTAYHVSDFASLGLRFQKVFDWAFDDLRRHLTETQQKEFWREDKRRPVFGIPGNHDYYDMINGFNRQFCRPITRETRFINLQGRNLPPQLRLWPFKRFQTASYVALRLPFDWWLWGVDSQLARVDLRQQEFFKRSYAMSLRGEERTALEEQIKASLRKELEREPTDDEFLRRFPRLFQTGLGNVWAMPGKLIVATSAPTTVEGRRPSEDEQTSEAFSFLDLTRPFLYLSGRRGSKADASTLERRKAIRRKETEAQLHGFKCRLDISGDVHHYARYWGDDSLAGKNGAVSSPNYASIVSGGGGASMSPTQTDYDEVEEQTLYPGKQVSKTVIHGQLFKPWKVIRGGFVWLAGMVIAMTIYFGAKTHEGFTNSFYVDSYRFARDILTRGMVATPPAWFSPTGQVIELSVLLLLVLITIVGAGLYARWLFTRLTGTHDWGRDKLLNVQLTEFKSRTKGAAAAQDALRAAKQKLYGEFLAKIENQEKTEVSAGRRAGFWAVGLLSVLVTFPFWLLSRLDWVMGGSHVVYILAFLVFVGIAAGAIAYIVNFSKKKFAEFSDLATNKLGNDVQQITRMMQVTVTNLHDYVPFWLLMLAAFSNLLLVRRMSMNALPMFGNSTVVLFSIFVAGGASVVAMYYSKWLFDQSYRIKVNLYSYVPVMVLSVTAITVLGSALWLFAIDPGRNIIADSLYLLVIIAVLVGCLALAVAVGNHVKTVRRNAAFAVIGIWHGLLQLLLPFLLVWFASDKAFLVAFFSVAGFSAAGLLALKYLRVESVVNRLVLPIAWFLFGGWMLIVPIIWQHPRQPSWVVPEHVVVAGAFLLVGILAASLTDFQSMKGRLVPPIAGVAGAVIAWLAYRYSSFFGTCLLAGLIGALMSCVWLGWYFATALVLDGHANEAGSTARTEDYKHFIRFRLTKDALTGFVIAIDFPHAPQEGDDPYRDGSTLKPRLVDVFTLRCASPPEPT